MDDDFDINALSKKEQRELYARLAYSLREADLTLSAEDYAFWNDIADAIHAPKNQRTSLGSYLKAKAGRVATFRSAQAMFEVVLAEAAPPNADKTLLAALRVLLLQCLIIDMQNGKIPLHFDTMIKCCEYLRTAVDNAYPGYLRSGILHHVVISANSSKPTRKNSLQFA